MSDDNGANGSAFKAGERAGETHARLVSLEDFVSDHKEDHRKLADEMKAFTRWQGGLAVLIFILGIVGPLIAAELVNRGRTP